MKEISDSEFTALISLLDDPDEEVIMHVSTKLKELGIKGVPKLEMAWESAIDLLQQSRIEEVISDIQFDKLKQELINWKQKDANDLLLGAILIAKFRYPDLDESEIYVTIEKLVQAVWLELNNGLTSIEETNVVNNVLFTLTGFKGEQDGLINADLSYINKVLELKKGNANSLGILYLVLCKELNLPIFAIDLPHYFVLAYMSNFYDRDLIGNATIKDVTFYINPVNEGLVFQTKQIEDYLKQLGIEPKEHHFLPCDNIKTITALVQNLVLCHEQKGQESKAKQFKELYDILMNDDISVLTNSNS